MIKIKKEKLNKKNLYKLKEINDFFYEDNLSLEWYYQRCNNKHDIYFLYNENLCIGYISCVAIKKELYDTLKNGVILDDININPKMFVKKSEFYYISSIVLSEEYRNIGLGSILMESLLNTNKGNFIALTISKKGYHLCKKYMKLIRKLNKNVKVFELKN